MSKFQTWWWFTFRNPVIRKGESGGFKWCFRRLDLRIETLSGNFKARFTAAENPYAYLLASDDDSQVEGFCQILYSVGMLLTTDQEFVDSITKALRDYDKRLNKKAASEVAEDETEEKIALEEVKQVQEFVEMDRKEQKKRERDVNGRFVKAVKDLEKSE
jgi:hypothetical protein